VGIVSTYLAHVWSVRRSEKKRFMPYLLRLYGIAFRTMEKGDATMLKSRYEKLRVGSNSRNGASYYTSEWVHVLPFAHSYNCLVDVIRECRDFEFEYAEMEKKGLIQALKLRKKKLHESMWSFHFAAEQIVRETNAIIDRLVKATEMRDISEFDSIFESDVLKKMLELSTRDLFRSASESKKQLESYV